MKYHKPHAGRCEGSMTNGITNTKLRAEGSNSVQLKDALIAPPTPQRNDNSQRHCSDASSMSSSAVKGSELTQLQVRCGSGMNTESCCIENADNGQFKYENQTMDSSISTRSDSSALSDGTAVSVRNGSNYKHEGRNCSFSNSMKQPKRSTINKYTVMTMPKRSLNYDNVPPTVNSEKKGSICCFRSKPAINRLEKEIIRLENQLIAELPDKSADIVRSMCQSRKIIRRRLAEAHENYNEFNNFVQKKAHKSQLIKQEKVIDFVSQQEKIFLIIAEECEVLNLLIFQLREVEEKPVNLLEILHYLSQEGANLDMENRVAHRHSKKQTIVYLQALIDNLKLVNGVASCKGDGSINIKRRRNSVRRESSDSQGGTNNNNRVRLCSQIHNEVRRMKTNVRELHSRIMDYTGWSPDYIMRYLNRSNVSGDEYGKYTRLVSVLYEEQDPMIVSKNRTRNLKSNDQNKTKSKNKMKTSKSCDHDIEKVCLKENEPSQHSTKSDPANESDESVITTIPAIPKECTNLNARNGEERKLKSERKKKYKELRNRLLSRQSKKNEANHESNQHRSNDGVHQFASSVDALPLSEKSQSRIKRSPVKKTQKAEKNPSNSSIACTNVTPYEGDNSFESEGATDVPDSNPTLSKLFLNSLDEDIGTSMQANMSCCDYYDRTCADVLDALSAKTLPDALTVSGEFDIINICTDSQMTATMKTFSTGSKSARCRKAAASQIMVELFGKSCKDQDDCAKLLSCGDKSQCKNGQHGDVCKMLVKRGDSNPQGDSRQPTPVSQMESRIDQIIKTQYLMMERMESLETCIKRKENAKGINHRC